MNVLHILDELHPSGAEVMLRVAAPHWAAAGVEGHILSKGRVLGAFAPILRDAGYQIHHLPFEQPLAFLRQYIQFLRAEAFDTVHVHTEHANFWLALCARAAGVPSVVRTVHNVFSFSGATRVERRVQRWMLRQIGVQHISIGASVAQAERDHFGNPTTLIPNWYDTKRFTPPTPDQRRVARQQLGLGKDEFVIATVGNCSHVKNHTALVEALAAIDTSQPIVYLHAGQEDADQSERVLAGRLGLGGRIRFLGFVRDVCTVLHATDVYVMPSLYEGFPISAIEAMGAGTPVLLTSVPGMKDLAAFSDDIVWADPTADALAAALQSLLDEPAVARVARGRALHYAVRDRLSPERAVAAYLDAYRKDSAPALATA